MEPTPRRGVDRMVYSRQPGHRILLLLDVEGFGSAERRRNPVQEAVRDGLYQVLRWALNAANISWEDCYHEDRGDGVLVLIAPQVPKAPFVESLPQMLIKALLQYNESAARPEERIRLRMALHAGEIKHDTQGVTGPSIIRAFRLIEAPALKTSLAQSPGVLAFIVSDWFFEEVVQNSSIDDPSRYQPVTVKVKETNTRAWICLPDHPYQRETEQLTEISAPRQLPARSGLFTGRIRELAELTASSIVDAEFKGTTPIMVVSGMGGIGKTWLALEWAHENIDRFPDGQLYVNLRGYDPSGAPVAGEVAIRGFLDALCSSQREIPVGTAAQAALYRRKVADRRMLILLDNARGGAQVVPLLPQSSSCTVLITTRHQPTELIVAHGARPLSLGTLNDTEARELLTKRLGPHRVEAEPAAVKDLVGYCAGLPLALSIVAAHAAAHHDFPLAALATDLGDASARLDALDGGGLSANLRTVLSWSYQTLDAQTAEVFRMLGLAPGPDIGEVAAGVLTNLKTDQARNLLRRLEEAHLLQRYLPTRYRMHDLVRLYAAEWARQDDQALGKLNRLISYYIHAGYAGERMLYPDRKKVEIGDAPVEFELPSFTDDSSILAWFDQEHPCLIAAQTTAERLGWQTQVWQLAWILHGYLWRRGHLHEQRTTWEAGLAAARELDDATIEGLAHRLLGQAYARSQRLTEALEHLYRGRELAKETGDTHGEARSYYDLIMVWRQQNNDQLALNHAKEAFRLFEPLDNLVWKAEALDRMGWHQARLGLYDEARSSCEQALALFRDARNRQGQAVTLDTLGYIAHHCGEYDLALDHFHESLELCRDLGATYYEADTLEHLGQSLAALRRRAEARLVWQQALRLNRTQERTADADRVAQQLAALDDESVS
ncbi:SARP family transcriptional regulator [Amycolatopsis sp. WAC 04182]|nr:SARP family transcriptional regulator [Amycolatopsis sp. WAC 04182]